MKIAIASDDGRTITDHFGRSRGFVICNIENGRVIGREYRANVFTGHSNCHNETKGAADHHGSIFAALSDCVAVISHGMGRCAYDDMTRHGIDVYLTAETEVEPAVGLFLTGNLKHRPELSCNHHDGPHHRAR
jgi:predicted Fe-Mo cluster-binding NifX family protein